jgi:two-component system sensor histidine kinase AtoS
MFRQINIFWKLSVTFILIILLSLMILNWAEDYISLGIPRFFLAAIIMILLSCGFARFFVRIFIKRPVRRLADGMNRLAEKELEYRLDENGKDEFSSLATSFNDMAIMLSSCLIELDKTRDYLYGILESSADLIITVTPSGKIRTFNTGAENALGYRRRDVVGKPITMLFVDPHDREIAIEKLKFTDNVFNYKTRFITKSGESRDVLLTLSRFRNSTGDIIGTIGISKDITEEKRLQDQLMQSERFIAIGQVFTGIQHSMKNMLNACTGGAYMVKTGLAKDNRKMLEEGWKIVQEGISRMTDMSQDMLKYVKEWKPKFDHVNLAQTLSGIDRVFRQTAIDSGVKFRLNITPGLPSVSCDARMIHSVVMDIVSNALDACRWKDYKDDELPEIVLSAYMDNDTHKSIIEIKDNGCGMTEEVKASIFTPFFSTKSKAGTGLGLSITSRMVDVHGGVIDVESEPDKGTVFRIILPMDENSRSKENHDGKKSFGG